MTVNPHKSLIRRSLHQLNQAMPVALDTAGIILLSVSFMLINTVAGVAAAGIACFVLNWRIYGR